MALTKYEGKAEIYVNGRLMAEARSAEGTIRSNDNDVNTMIKGFAGFSDGPTSVEGTIESAIPKAGFEKDFVEAVEEKQAIRLVVVHGNRRRTFEGRFTEATWNNATDQSALIRATFRGRPAATL